MSPGEEPQQVLHLQGLALTALGRYSAAVESYSLATQRPQPTAERSLEALALSISNNPCQEALL